MGRIGWVGLALVLGTMANAKTPGIFEYTSGYLCTRSADGAFGHIDLTQELWEDGHFRIIKAKWRMASDTTVLIAPPGGTKLGYPVLTVDFYTADARSAPQLRGALATLEITPIVYDTLFLYATLDGGVQTLMPRFNGLQYVFDLKFLSALPEASDATLDLIRQDGSEIARMQMRFSDTQQGREALARLEAEARAAALDFRNRCEAETTIILPS